MEVPGHFKLGSIPRFLLFYVWRFDATSKICIQHDTSMRVENFNHFQGGDISELMHIYVKDIVLAKKADANKKK